MLNEWCSKFTVIDCGKFVQIVTNTWGESEDVPIILYETIELETFPSDRDFKGSSSTVMCGSYALIVDIVGRPDALNPAENIDLGAWGSDIYKVLIDSELRHVLRCQLRECEW